jgi:hypothetical protein
MSRMPDPATGRAGVGLTVPIPTPPDLARLLPPDVL